MLGGILKSFLSTALLCVLLVSNVQANIRTGYTETIAWWNDVQKKMVPYELQLQQLYAEVEATPGILPSKVNQEFSRRLARDFPGSNYFGSIGSFKINNYTTLTFSQNWKIRRLVQQFGDLSKNYDFQRNTLALSSGSNRVNLKLDLNSPENSQVASAAIPAITATATTIYQSRPAAKQHRDGLADIINDVYRFEIATIKATRMDQFAERLLTDIPFRGEVLSLADGLYLNPPKELIARTKKARDFSPSVNVKTASGGSAGVGLLISALSSIPFFAYVLLGGVVVVSGLTTARRAKKYSKRASLFEMLLRSFLKEHDRIDKSHYESRGSLNSPAEQKFQEILEDVLDTEIYTLHGKTRLADILKIKENFDFGSKQAAFNRISRKHVDFVITEKQSSRIVGVIELDDRSHQRADRRRRDQQVDQWLKEAGIPILHYPCRREYSFVELQRSLSEAFGITAKPFGDFR